MCGDSPDYSVAIAVRGAHRNLKKSRALPEPERCAGPKDPGPERRWARKQAAPLAGAPPRKPTSDLATKRAPSLSSRLAATGLAWPDTPPAAGRAWVPGCRARTLLRPYHQFYDEIADMKSPIV